MGKIKVHELAKKLNISNAQLIEKLNKMGVEVKSHLSTLEEDIVKKVMGSKDLKELKDKKEQMHIIRRNVKVIRTEGKTEQINEISTSISGDMKKTKHVENNKDSNNSKKSKEGLGIVKPKNHYPRNNNKFANRTMNVVITRNGKPVEKKEEKEANQKVVEEKEIKQTKKTNKSNLENENTSPKIDNREKNNYRKEQKTNQKNNDNRVDNRNKRNNYNKNNDNRQNDRKKFQNDNKGNDRDNNYKNRHNNDYNKNNGFQRRNSANNTNYQVNKFIKQESNNPVETKETREYNNFEKKKYVDKSSDNKKDKIDKNKLRERNSRVSTSKLKGMEIDSSTGLLDLYERDNDNSRKYSAKRKKQNKPTKVSQTKIIPMTEVKLPETMTVKEFAESIKKQASEIIKKLFALGIMATVNQEIDFDTAYLIASDFGITATKQVQITEEDILFDDSEDDEKDLEPRAPIVVVMGHVDHGKTSLLDRIRSENVVSGEAGGITQHIGAYKVKCKDKEICFLDTPGHEAFTAMRARGAQVTDIAIIVVAADDGIKPQTIEAIDHAKAAGVSIIVAINKIDKPTANIEKVKQELLEVGLVAEEWGGDTICVPISAKTGEGIDNLLEMILLVADMKELKVNPHKQAKGTILEARLDKNIGTIVSVLVQRGELNVGDTIVVGDIIGKIRAMKDDKGKRVKMAGPSTPVEIIGLSHVPHTGDVFYEVENEKVAKHLVEKRKATERRKLIKQGSKVTLDDLFGQIKQGKLKELNVIIKADVQGSVEALKDSLEKLSTDEVVVKVLHASTGGIKESDVTLASVSNAIIIGFNVRPESLAKSQAEKENVDLRLYRVIYDAIDDVEVALKGLLPKKYKEVMHGTCEVRRIFKITGVGIVAGCYVKTGNIVRGAMVRLVRDSIVVFDAKIDSLKREKDDVKEVAQGYECGIKLEGISDIKEGDIFECYELIEEKR